MATAGADIAPDASDAARPAARSAGAPLPYPATIAVLVLTFWCVDIISPALPEMKNGLALTATGAGLVYSLLFTGRLVGNFPSPLLLDRLGVALTTMIGGALLAGGSALVAIAEGLPLALLGRTVQGVAIALLVNAALRSMIALKPGRGTAMVLFGVFATCGGITGLQTGGILTEREGWRTVFAVSAVLGLLIVVTSFGAFLFNRRKAVRAFVPIAPGTEDEPAPAVPRHLVIGGLILNFVVAANYCTWAVLPLYLEQRFDASPQVIANLMLVVTGMHIVGAYPAAWSIRRIGSVPTLIIGLAIAGVGGLLVLPMGSAPLVALPLVLYGGGLIAAGNASGDIILHMGRGGSRAVRQVRVSGDLGLVAGAFASGKIADLFGYGAPIAAMATMTAAASIVLLLGRSAFDAHD